MNSELLSYLQQRAEEAANKLQSINEQIQKLNAQRESLMGDIDGYKRTILAETREGGHQTVSDAFQFADEVKAEIGINKAEFARQFVRSRAQFGGVSPGDIFAGFRTEGISITKPYVYSLVQRLKAQGAIRQKRGKWIPVEPEANGVGAHSG